MSQSFNPILEQHKLNKGLLYDKDDWVKTPFVFSLPDPSKGQVFNTYEEMLAFTCDPEQNQLATGKDKASTAVTQKVQQIHKEKYLRLNPRNTSLGGNEALNCYPQFNEDDDIVHLMTAAETIGEGENLHILSGLGRVYSEVYDSNQKVMHITAGVCRYNNIGDFYENVVNTEAAELIHGSEAGSSFASALGGAVGDVLLLPLKIMYLPIRYFNKMLDAVSADGVTRYYDFWSDMVLFYKHVNDILMHLTVNLGLYENSTVNDGGTVSVTGAGIQKVQQTLEAASREAMSTSMTGNVTQEIPYFLQHGIDMFKIVSRRELFNGNSKARNNASKLGSYSTAKAFSERVGQKSSPKDGDVFSPHGSYLDQLATSAWNSATSGDKFFGIRIEKSTDSSESFSNSTGESSVAQTLNSAISSAREAAFSAGFNADKTGGSGILGTAVGAGVDLIKGASKALGGALESVSNVIAGGGATAFAKNMITGNAYVDIPEVWTGSQFSKSYSFRMQLRDPHGGNPVSFLYNIGVPLACMLALTLPRSAGESSYGHPFFIRAYCKGMFAIPFGIVENMTITRGAPEHGWSTYGLPTVVEISFSIKDLATVMHMALNEPSIFPRLFGTNSPFQEYLLTLSSMGTKERLLMIPKLKQRFQLWLEQWDKNSPLNGSYLGAKLGNTGIGQLYGAISPYSGIPE